MTDEEAVVLPAVELSLIAGWWDRKESCISGTKCVIPRTWGSREESCFSSSVSIIWGESQMAW